jgi:chromosome segregation ATPase
MNVDQWHCRPPCKTKAAALVPPASTDKSRALHAYICDLETEKLELQRGLQRQSELVERIASEHQDSTSRFATVAEERDRLERDLNECRASLAVQVCLIAFSGTPAWRSR